jgi:hypothetical protein
MVVAELRLHLGLHPYVSLLLIGLLLLVAVFPYARWIWKFLK